MTRCQLYALSAIFWTLLLAASLVGFGLARASAPAQAGPVTRISFPPGGTSAQVWGQVFPGGTNHYVLRVMAGQTMAVSLTSSQPGMPAQSNLFLVIWGADGTVLLSDHASATAWQGTAPLTEDYTIDVSSVAPMPMAYTLQVTVPPLAPKPPATPQAKRISFPPGATSAQVPGQVAPGQSNRYVLKVMAGQSMTVQLLPGQSGQPVQNILALAIWGADGTVLISDHAGATWWQGMIPSTQDYFIAVESTAQVPMSYVMRVTIPPLGSKPPPTVPPATPTTAPQAIRIDLTAGGPAVLFYGHAEAGATNQVVAQAAAGQVLSVRIGPASAGQPVAGQLALSVRGANGVVLLPASAGATSWQGALPSTQDYYIGVQSLASAPMDYTLQMALTSTVPAPPTGTAAGYVPLSPAECTALGTKMMQTLGVPVMVAQAPFQDYISGQSGTGCEMTATGTGADFTSLDGTATALDSALQAQGWSEDIQYQAGGPTGIGSGWRKGSDLCLLSVGWQPSAEANCPKDQPISACNVPPEEQMYTIALNCAQPAGQ